MRGYVDIGSVAERVLSQPVFDVVAIPLVAVLPGMLREAASNVRSRRGRCRRKWERVALSALRLLISIFVRLISAAGFLDLPGTRSAYGTEENSSNAASAFAEYIAEGPPPM